MSGFASGKNAWGRCQRCGDRVRYLQLRPDGDVPGLLVCGPCYDIPHPAEKPFVASDSEALRRPSPDTDDDSGGAGGTLAATLFSGLNYFGGGT